MNIHKLVAIGASASLAVVAMATLATNFGPFASTSPDSGTCGNDWANDTFDRFFHVDKNQNADGTYTVTEDFRNGSFTTVVGASPGSCQPGNTAQTVNAGIQGHFQGTFTVVVSNGTFNPDADTSAVQNTADFVAAVFGPGATYDIPTFNFNYNAGKNGEWKNASADRGGNHGDIYSILP